MVQFELEKVDRLKESPLYKVYAEVAPRPHDWPVLFQKLAVLLSHEYDWSDDVAKIAAPTLLVFADADSLSPAHAAEFFGLLGGGKKDAGWDGAGRGHSQLAILPGTTHYNILASPLFPTVVTSFLADAKR